MQKTPITIENIPDVKGMLTAGSVTACATAAQAATDGTAKAQCLAFASRMHGYADVNKTNIPGARNIEIIVPRPCAYHCLIGGVPSKKPVRKSAVSDVATSAPPEARPPATKLTRCASLIENPLFLVAAPKIS